MKNINTVLNIILLIAVGVLFYLVLNKQTPKALGRNNVATAKAGASAPIAYFEMDTLEQHYNYIKDVREQLKGRQQAIAAELENTKKGYLNRVHQLQMQSKDNMSQEQGQAAQEEIDQMQQQLQQAEAKYSQELQELNFNLMQDVYKKIEDYLKTYNEEKRYAYIVSHQPGDFLYYKDSTNNITDDLIKGLNEGYKKKP